MQRLICTLPLARVPQASLVASNDDQLHTGESALCTATSCAAQVRWMCRAKDAGSSRFALSGKLADVCAALDELAAQEVRNAWRCVSY